MKFFIVMCLMVLFIGLATCQMTFTDQWTKKRAMHKNIPSSKPQQPSPSNLDDLPEPSDKFQCAAERTQQIIDQLQQLQNIQSRLVEYLSLCNGAAGQEIH